MTRLIRGFLLIALCSVLTLHAQQGAGPQPQATSDAQTFRLKTSVHQVVVDVTVTDAHGDSVHGLSKDDFVVEEDGEPQRVLSFDSYNFDKGMDYVPPKLPKFSPNTFVDLPANPERGPLYVLYYDLVNIPIKEQIIARARLIKFIQEKPPGARFAILVCSDDVHLVQGFTSDESKLLAAVDANGTGPHVPKVFLMGTNFGQGDSLGVAERLSSIAEYLAPMEGRKILIWFASKFPLSLFPSQDETENYQEEAKKTLDLFSNNQIAIYTVDVSGVVPTETYAPPSDVGNGASSPKPKIAAYNHGISLTFSSFIKQDEIARATGGKALYSSNDLVGSLEKVTDEAGSYYTLGYSPSNKDFDGHLRHIKVRLKEGKYQLAYRHAYYAVKEDDPATSKTPADSALSAGMKHGAPEFHQLVFEAHVTPPGPPVRGTKEQMVQIAKAQGSARPLKPVPLQAYTIDYAMMAKQLKDEDDPAPQFEVAAAVFDDDGRLLNLVDNTTVNSAPAAQAPAKPQSVYRVEQQLDAPVDAKFMRMAVRDVHTGKLGTIEIPLPLAAAK